jgi:hypothetical protein
MLLLPSTVPFEEDERDPRTWFLDHNFIEDMQTMFKKVSGRFNPNIDLINKLC